MEDLKKEPVGHTVSPIVTGGSVIGVKYCDGILLCADTQACYGSCRKFKDFCRIAQINDKTAMVATGEMSDFQAVKEYFDQKNLEDSIQEDGTQFHSAKDYANYLAEWSYYRRRKLDPLLNTTLVGGFDSKGEKYLGYIDPYGTLIEGDWLVGGLAHYFCKVLLTNYSKPTMTEAEAKQVLEQCMRVLLYRDARASHNIQFCTITKKGVILESPYNITSSWNNKFFIEETNEKLRGVPL